MSRVQQSTHEWDCLKSVSEFLFCFCFVLSLLWLLLALFDVRGKNIVVLLSDQRHVAIEMGLSVDASRWL